MRIGVRALTALAVVACASGAPQPKPKPPAPAVAEPKAPAPERADTSPVARPDNVIAIARVGSPGATFERLAEWQGRGGFAGLADSLVPGLGEHAAPDAPLDWIVAIERSPGGPIPEPSAVLSIGISSLADARAELSARDVRVRRGPPGVLLIREGTDRPCALAPARGVAAGRLVCADSDRALEELLPYATRGLAAEPAAPDDARLDVDVARLRGLHGKRLEDLKRWALPFVRLGISELEPRLARGVAPLLETLYDETLALLGDVDRIELTAKLEATHASFTGEITLGREPRAYFLETLLELGPRQAPPPPDFWKLPGDAHFAFYSHGIAAARAGTLRKTLSGMLARAAPTPTPGATFDLIVEALFPEPPFVYAFGLLEPKLGLTSSYADQIRRRTRRVLGWHVVGIETDPRALEKRLDRGMKDYNAGPLRELVYGEFPGLCPGLPKITRRPAPRKGLPAGSVLYEMVVPGKLFEDCAARHGLRSARPPDPLGIAVVFVPGKPRSWIVISPDTQFAVGKMRELLSGAEATRLSSVKPQVPELEAAGLFGWVVSEELTRLQSRGVEWIGPPRARASFRAAVDGRKKLGFSGRVPASAFR